MYQNLTMEANILHPPRVHTFDDGGTVANFWLSHYRTYWTTGPHKEQKRDDCQINAEWYGEDGARFAEEAKEGDRIVVLRAILSNSWQKVTEGGRRHKIVIYDAHNASAYARKIIARRERT